MFFVSLCNQKVFFPFFFHTEGWSGAKQGLSGAD